MITTVFCGMGMAEDVEASRAAKFEALRPHLDERQRRLTLSAAVRESIPPRGPRPALLVPVQPDVRGDPISSLRGRPSRPAHSLRSSPPRGIQYPADTVTDMVWQEGYVL